MNADKATPSAPAPSPRQKGYTDFKTLCDEIRKKAVLTPPGVIDRLCDGKLFLEICKEAIYTEELEEFASLLNRSHLLTFEKYRRKI
jgi:hypothetical protein